MRTLISLLTTITFIFAQLPASADNLKTIRVETNRRMYFEFLQVTQSKDYFKNALEKRLAKSKELPEILKALDNNEAWPEFTRLKDGILISSKSGSYTVKFVNLINGELEVNSKAFHINPTLPLLPQAEALQKLVGKKKSSIRFSIVPEAEAYYNFAALGVIALVLGVGALLGILGECTWDRFVGIAKKLTTFTAEPDLKTQECLTRQLQKFGVDKYVQDFTCNSAESVSVKINPAGGTSTVEWAITADSGSKKISTVSMRLPNGTKSYTYKNGNLYGYRDDTKSPPVEKFNSAWDSEEINTGQDMTPYLKYLVDICQPENHNEYVDFKKTFGSKKPMKLEDFPTKVPDSSR